MDSLLGSRANLKHWHFHWPSHQMRILIAYARSRASLPFFKLAATGMSDTLSSFARFISTVGTWDNLSKLVSVWCWRNYIMHSQDRYVFSYCSSSVGSLAPFFGGGFGFLFFFHILISLYYHTPRKRNNFAFLWVGYLHWPFDKCLREKHGYLPKTKSRPSAASLVQCRL